MRILATTLFCLLYFYISAQKEQGIKDPGRDRSSKCAACIDFLRDKPKEAQFRVDITPENEIFFEFTDRDWFLVFFRNKKDGIAVDLLTKDQFSCDSKENKFGPGPISQGIMLPPIYRDEMMEKVTERTDFGFKIKVGDLPANLAGKEVEPRLILISGGIFCHSEFFYDIPSVRWDILNMGMLAEDIVYKDSLSSAFWAQDSSVLNRWHMRFVYHFEKAKFDYSAQDLKPLYDSLNLTQYDITSIIIRSFSSVDGPTDKNIMLQEKRAQNIIKVLQDYQTYEFEKKILAEENWDEFYRDIKKTKYANLGTLSKEEIKDSLRVDSIEFGLEPILSRHRKAVLHLILKRKDTLSFDNPEKLIMQFKDAIRDSMPMKASDVQNAVYNKIIKGEFPVEIADKIEFPEHDTYVPMANSMGVFNYMTGRSDIRKTLNLFTQLNRQMPDNGKVRYNLCVAKLLSWNKGKRSFDHKNLEEEIKFLYELKVDPKLISKLLLNYHILLSEYYMNITYYKQKDKAVKYIFSNYTSTHITDADALSLSKYLASYGNTKWARMVLKPRISQEIVDEEIIFYYIHLSIVEPTVARNSSFGAVLEKAYKINAPRLCELFHTRGHGGITFQLLREAKLKKKYCELCAE